MQSECHLVHSIWLTCFLSLARISCIHVRESIARLYCLLFICLLYCSMSTSIRIWQYGAHRPRQFTVTVAFHDFWLFASSVPSQTQLAIDERKERGIEYMLEKSFPITNKLMDIIYWWASCCGCAEVSHVRGNTEHNRQCTLSLALRYKQFRQKNINAQTSFTRTPTGPTNWTTLHRKL